MGATKIQWANYTFNPWIGCTKVDELCANCYAEGEDKRRGWTPEGWGKGKPRKRTTVANWREPLKWDAEAAGHPYAKCEACGAIVSGFFRSPVLCNCRGRLIPNRPRVFCASLADVFDQEVDDQWRWDLFRLIEQTPNLDWLLLTKRPGAARMFLQRVPKWPWPNVWLGTSVGTQAGWEERVPELLKTTAVVRFLSMEPLLEPVTPGCVSITPSIVADPLRNGSLQSGRIDWIICGGESGPKARPMHPEWARDLRDACASADVPFFFKQWGEWLPRNQFRPEHVVPACALKGSKTGVMRRDGGIDESLGTAHSTNDQESAVYRVGKHLAGRLLDGVEHNGFPTPTPRPVLA